MRTTIYARPHINGNDPKDFVDAGGRMVNAANRLQQEIDFTMAMVCHGRNRQHMEADAGQMAGDLDYDLRVEMTQAVTDIKSLGQHIRAIGIEAINERSRARAAHEPQASTSEGE